MNSGFTEEQKQELAKLKNILSIFIANGIHCKFDVDLETETLVFDVSDMNLPFKDELVAAGATYDIGRSRWTFFSDV